ncbi:hypothetical protein EQG49_07905 [Periweissella cryptocerci]|uniref:Uncharacterized protein n=1 Tax=Periweissella cryptocerci TaxID=2506420 RepID=A0A4P6YUK4_9LACO|nr:hypothetical protein [Periweissella cryptocerci]QBO36393.1 hypothetical protein EQG49_07905 [Periweissella cryptocerci]
MTDEPKKVAFDDEIDTTKNDDIVGTPEHKHNVELLHDIESEPRRVTFDEEVDIRENDKFSNLDNELDA